jgi:hypothetical protein
VGGGVLADPVLARVHQGGDLRGVGAAFRVGDAGNLRGPRADRERIRPGRRRRARLVPRNDPASGRGTFCRQTVARSPAAVGQTGDDHLPQLLHAALRDRLRSPLSAPYQQPFDHQQPRHLTGSPESMGARSGSLADELQSLELA